MYRTTLRNGKTVSYYINELPGDEAEEDYISVAVPSEDDMVARSLTRKGFIFADRRITVEIPLKGFRSALDSGKKFERSISDQWSEEELYNVAKDSFKKDVRFALDIAGEDINLKNELLYGFIKEQKRQGAKVTYVWHEGRLEGFNLWYAQDGIGRVELGAVSVRYQRTGIAVPLYSHTIIAMRELFGASVLRNFVASSNTASLNLHSMLARCAGAGLRFGPGKDHYKKEKDSMAKNDGDSRED